MTQVPGLSRERVIALTGSSARLKLPAVVSEPTRYHYGDEQLRIEAATRRDFARMVGLFICGLSTQAIGNCWEVSRQAVDKRFHRAGIDGSQPRRRLRLPSLIMPTQASIADFSPEERRRLGQCAGGQSRVASLSPEQRTALARMAAKKRWSK